MPSVEDTAMFLHCNVDFGHDIEDATKILKTMMDEGSKYKQLEAALGAGVCLVLPTNIGETNSWTKILTKSTERNRSVIRKLRQTPILTLAGEYATLRERIVSFKMAELQSLQHAILPEVATAPSQSLFEGLDIQDQGFWNDFNTNLNVDLEPFDYLGFGP
ncbi:hypothetical protein LTR09_011370 [Extremus antarcticus]|uniref:Uncharacterized protein n=1 Tax=Extremus antarcticus TaxID=702011 RepID=A0AAJ0G507_9PEZI|nr:hypothetical protein LTR09_011370 [Extremus antarcticus]